MAFRVGQKVVCIEDQSGFKGARGPRFDYVIKRGEIYVIRWIGEHSYFGQDYIGVRLSGIVRADIDDTPFHSERFRPVVERKTDISIFTAMLNPSLETLREIIREQVT